MGSISPGDSSRKTRPEETGRLNGDLGAALCVFRPALNQQGKAVGQSQGAVKNPVPGSLALCPEDVPKEAWMDTELSPLLTSLLAPP